MDWKLAYYNKNSTPELAEPVHRIGPRGVSTGLSIRQLPRPSLHQIRLICQHYQSKCSGKYHDSALAARYLFQMSEEILLQINALESQIEEYNQKMENMQEKMTEFDEHFGWDQVASDDVGCETDTVAGLQHQTKGLGPREIAEKLKHQAQRIQELEQQIQEQHQSNASGTEQLKQSLNSFSVASNVQHQEDKRQHEAAVSYLIAKHHEDMKDIEQKHRSQLSCLTKEQGERFRKLEKTAQSKIAALNQLITQHVSEKEKMKQTWEEKEQALIRTSEEERSLDNVAWQQRLEDIKREHSKQIAALLPSPKESVGTQDCRSLFSSLSSLEKENLFLKRRQRELEDLVSSFRAQLLLTSTASKSKGIIEGSRPQHGSLRPKAIDGNHNCLTQVQYPNTNAERSQKIGLAAEQYWSGKVDRTSLISDQVPCGRQTYYQQASSKVKDMDWTPKLKVYNNEWDKWPKDVSRSEYLLGQSKRGELGASRYTQTNLLFQKV